MTTAADIKRLRDRAFLFVRTKRNPALKAYAIAWTKYRFDGAPEPAGDRAAIGYMGAQSIESAIDDMLPASMLPPPSAPVHPSDRTFNIIVVNDSTGYTESMTSAPLSHAEACVMMNKLTPYAHARYVLEDASLPGSVAATAARDGAPRRLGIELATAERNACRVEPGVNAAATTRGGAVRKGDTFEMADGRVVKIASDENDIGDGLKFSAWPVGWRLPVPQDQLRLERAALFPVGTFAARGATKAKLTPSQRGRVAARRSAHATEERARVGDRCGLIVLDAQKRAKSCGKPATTERMLSDFAGGFVAFSACAACAAKHDAKARNAEDEALRAASLRRAPPTSVPVAPVARGVTDSRRGRSLARKAAYALRRQRAEEHREGAPTRRAPPPSAKAGPVSSWRTRTAAPLAPRSAPRAPAPRPASVRAPSARPAASVPKPRMADTLRFFAMKGKELADLAKRGDAGAAAEIERRKANRR